jgi:hypothetical protein
MNSEVFAFAQQYPASYNERYGVRAGSGVILAIKKSGEWASERHAWKS